MGRRQKDARSGGGEALGPENCRKPRLCAPVGSWAPREDPRSRWFDAGHAASAELLQGIGARQVGGYGEWMNSGAAVAAGESDAPGPEGCPGLLRRLGYGSYGIRPGSRNRAGRVIAGVTAVTAVTDRTRDSREPPRIRPGFAAAACAVFAVFSRNRSNCRNRQSWRGYGWSRVFRNCRNRGQDAGKVKHCRCSRWRQLCDSSASARGLAACGAWSRRCLGRVLAPPRRRAPEQPRGDRSRRTPRT